MPEEAPRRARVADILSVASFLWGVPVPQLTGKQRHQYLCKVRFACALIAKEHGHSFPVIGRAMERDHSSIIHAARMAELHIERCPDYARRVSRFRDMVARAKPFVSERVRA